MRAIFWAEFTVLFSITLTFNGFGIRILPFWLCFLIGAWGCKKMQDEAASFRTAGKLYLAAALVAAVSSVLAAFGQSDVLGVARGWLDLAALYLVIDGLGALEGRLGDLRADVLRRAWMGSAICLLLGQLGGFLARGLMQLTLIAGLLVLLTVVTLCFRIWMLVLLWQAGGRYASRSAQL